MALKFKLSFIIFIIGTTVGLTHANALPLFASAKDFATQYVINENNRCYKDQSTCIEKAWKALDDKGLVSFIDVKKGCVTSFKKDLSTAQVTCSDKCIQGCTSDGGIECKDACENACK